MKRIVDTAVSLDLHAPGALERAAVAAVQLLRRGRGPDRRRVGRLVRVVFEPHPGPGARAATGLHLCPAAQPDLLRQHADRQGRASGHAAARADGDAVRAHQLGLRAARGAMRPSAGAVLPRATDVRGDPARLAGDLRDDRGGDGAADRDLRRGPQRRQGAADRAHRRLVHQHPQRDLLRGARARGPHRARFGGRDLPGAARAVPRVRAHAHGSAGAQSSDLRGAAAAGAEPPRARAGSAWATSCW